MKRQTRKPKKKRATRNRGRRPASSRRGRSRWPLGLALIALLASGVYFLLPVWPFWQTGPAALPGRPVADTAELQIALARHGFSPGSVDGRWGSQTRLALQAFQESRGLEPSGELDESTRPLVRIEEPTHAHYELTTGALSRIVPAPPSWRARGEMPHLGYHRVDEMVGEATASDPDYLRNLNPGLDWSALRPGDRVLAPFFPAFRLAAPVERIDISLRQRSLRAYDAAGTLLFHCPVSIAREVAKRPVGTLRVKVRVEDPNYTFNPNILSAAAARELS
jgi:Putative peptidoglycan-binding domain-containing protein